MPLPTLVLIPGAFTPPTIYTPFLPYLAAEDITDVLALPLRTIVPSHPAPPPPTKSSPAPTMYDDAESIAAALRTLVVDQRKRVVLLGHSYGGVPVAQCTKGLSERELRAAGQMEGGVVRLVFLAAVVLRMGETASGGEAGDLAGAGYHTHYLTFPPDQAVQASFSDLPPAQALALAQLAQPMSAASQVSPLTWAGYADVPSTYIVTTRDAALPVETQRAYVEVLREARGPEGVEVLEMESGHAPNASRPEEFARLLRGVLERAAGEERGLDGGRI